VSRHFTYRDGAGWWGGYGPGWSGPNTTWWYWRPYNRWWYWWPYNGTYPASNAQYYFPYYSTTVVDPLAEAVQQDLSGTAQTPGAGQTSGAGPTARQGPPGQ
jgi:hypothetical protein